HRAVERERGPQLLVSFRAPTLADELLRRTQPIEGFVRHGPDPADDVGCALEIARRNSSSGLQPGGLELFPFDDSEHILGPTELDERAERMTTTGLVMRGAADLRQESVRALGHLVPETCEVAIGDESTALREAGVSAVTEMLRKPHGLFPARPRCRQLSIQDL